MRFKGMRGDWPGNSRLLENRDKQHNEITVVVMNVIRRKENWGICRFWIHSSFQIIEIQMWRSHGLFQNASQDSKDTNNSRVHFWLFFEALFGVGSYDTLTFPSTYWWLFSNLLIVTTSHLLLNVGDLFSYLSSTLDFHYFPRKMNLPLLF